MKTKRGRVVTFKREFKYGEFALAYKPAGLAAESGNYQE